MSPKFTSINGSNSFPYDSILFSDNAVESPLTQLNFDCLNLMYGKFLRYIITVSTFFDHIHHIISMCTQKKMRRITTTFIVACMQHIKIVWDRSMCQKPSKSVSINEMLFISEMSISLMTLSCCPIPTFVRAKLFHLVPETAGIRAIMTLIRFRKVDNRFAI